MHFSFNLNWRALNRRGPIYLASQIEISDCWHWLMYSPCLRPALCPVCPRLSVGGVGDGLVEEWRLGRSHRRIRSSPRPGVGSGGGRHSGPISPPRRLYSSPALAPALTGRHLMSDSLEASNISWTKEHKSCMGRKELFTLKHKSKIIFSLGWGYSPMHYESCWDLIGIGTS